MNNCLLHLKSEDYLIDICTIYESTDDYSMYYCSDAKLYVLYLPLDKFNVVIN